MTRFSFCFLLLILVGGCESKPQQESLTVNASVAADKVVDLSKFFVKANDTYADAKTKSVSVRNSLKAKYESAASESERETILEEAKAEIVRSVVNGIIPHWYGTPWDFNGYTAEPGKGVVACGYFVSTTMLHAGFNLNRYTLAQQSPRDEAISLNLSDTVPELREPSIDDIYGYFSDFPDGLSFVGLDFHVGYLLKENNQLYFIHSNYIEAQGVTIEPIEKSAAFKSKWYFIAPITYNRELVRKWVLNTPIKTYKSPD